MYLFYCFSCTFAAIENGNNTALHSFLSTPAAPTASPRFTEGRDTYVSSAHAFSYRPFDTRVTASAYLLMSPVSLLLLLPLYLQRTEEYLHTAFPLIFHGATPVLPFHFSHLCRCNTLPLSRKCSVVCPRAYFRPLRVVVVVVLPLYHQEERPIWHFAVALTLSVLSPVWRSVLSVLYRVLLGLRCKGTPIIWNIQLKDALFFQNMQ